MCGVVGLFRRDRSIGRPEAHPWLDRIAHRGPDGRGVFADDWVLLGHTRLSIIDLSDAGAQPMTRAGGRFTVSFNGEIYNHLELREELKALGAVFSGRSDTEIIPAAYAIWGVDCLKRFQGMFAFALWDAFERRLFLARDRCGEKPLFFWRDRKRFLFASELKALVPLLPDRPRLDPTAVDLYLHHQYTPEPLTPFADVRKLPAAHRMTLSVDDWDAEPERWWSLYDAPALDGNADEVVRSTLTRAVELTLRSDAPVALALSGGVDSSAVAALTAKLHADPIRALCVGYPGRPPYDERDQAKGLAVRLGLPIHEVEIPLDEFVDSVPKLVWMLDEPIADPAAFGHYTVPRAAAELGVKVLLTGIGGDELFWGYPWTVEAVRANELRDRLGAWPSPLRIAVHRFLAAYPGLCRKIANRAGTTAFLDALERALDPAVPPESTLFMSLTEDFRRVFSAKRTVYGPEMEGIDPSAPFAPAGRRTGDPALDVQQALFDTWLVSNCLTISDRLGMASGVETRTPLLDHRLIEAVVGLRKIRPDHTLGPKRRFRDALRGLLPDEVLARPKRGFQPPVWEWLGGALARYGDALVGGELERDGVLKTGGGVQLLRDAERGPSFELAFAHRMLMLELWCGQMRSVTL